MSDTDIYAILELISKRPPLYGRLPIPNPFDEDLMEAMERFRKLPERERTELRKVLNSQEVGTLSGFSGRMAILAVRRNKPKYLVNGVLALALGNFEPDYRDVYLVLSWSFRSCQLLGVSVKEIFAEAAQFVSPEAREHLLGFAERKGVVGEMGFVEVGSGENFSYEADESWSRSSPRRKTFHVSKNLELLIEGYTQEEIRALSDKELEALVLTNEPLVVRIGSAEVLGQFRLQADYLVVELAHVDGGGEGILANLWALAEQHAKRRGLRGVEWIVHATRCAAPNPKLRQVLERRGFVVRNLPGVGEAYFYRHEI